VPIAAGSPSSTAIAGFYLPTAILNRPSTMSDVSASDAPPTDAPLSASTDGLASGRFGVRDLLRFEKMLTPTLVRFVFYAGSVLLLIVGIAMLYGGVTARFGGGLRVVGGLLTLTAGPLLLRIVCEQIIVLFGIYDRLGEIRDGERIHR